MRLKRGFFFLMIVTLSSVLRGNLLYDFPSIHGLIYWNRDEMTFNGTSDKIEIEDSESFYTPDGLTVDVWVKSAVLTPGDLQPVDMWDR